MLWKQVSIQFPELFLVVIAQQETFRWVYQNTAVHGLSPKQHSVTHGVPVGQGDLNSGAKMRAADFGFNDIAFFRVSRGAFDFTLPNDQCFTGNGGLLVFL